LVQNASTSIKAFDVRLKLDDAGDDFCHIVGFDHDQQVMFPVGVLAPGLWRAIDNLLPLGSREYRHTDRLLEMCFDAICNQLGDIVRVGVVRFAQNIAALYICPDIAELGCSENSFEIGHFDDIFAADIDAAEEGEV